MDHLDEMTGAVLPAVEVAMLGGAGGGVLSSRRARDIADTGGEGLEDRIQPLHRPVRTADHHAVAALETPHATAGADIYIVDPLLRQFLGTPDVIDVIGVAAVNQSVADFE